MRSPLYLLHGAFAPWRRLLFFVLSFASTAVAAYVMTDILGSDSLTTAETAVIALFSINFLWIALSFYAGLAGLWLQFSGRDAISLRKNVHPAMPDTPLKTRTAIVFPIYQEDPQRVFAGLCATYQSLEATGHLASFDFFVLSDSRDPDAWALEELTWLAARDRLKAHERLFYRRRLNNSEKKAGNIADFCEQWGAHYESFIICDADSVMSGQTMVMMAHLMEQHPQVALIQSPPMPTGRNTLFARILQFISRVHGPNMSAGLAFWTLHSGNYWGHNAIIRVQPFVNCCGLPILSGKPPFGGAVMSHDFIEAALLRRAGHQVWLVPALGGSWEELPSNVLDYASRDRRWCRGNMQHIRFLAGRDFKAMSRLHIFMGIMSYLSSPLWLLLLFASTATAYESAVIGFSFFPDPYRLFPVWPVSRAADMLTLTGITLGMLIVPKFLSAFLLMRHKDEAQLYGGRGKLLLSMLAEMIFAMLLAPAMMIFHTRFVLGVFNGAPTAWEAQSRTDAAVPHKIAWHAQWQTVLLGVVWGVVAYTISITFFYWMLPVLLGLLLASALTTSTSRADFGLAARARHLFVTPEETAPPPELQLLAQHEAIEFLPNATTPPLQQLLNNPRALALHRQGVGVSAPTTERLQAEVALIANKIRRLGVESLTRDEKLQFMLNGAP